MTGAWQGDDRYRVDPTGRHIDVRVSANAMPDFEPWPDGTGAWLSFTDDDVVVRLAVHGDAEARGHFWARLESTGVVAGDEEDDGEWW
jgi:hypothetical protein